MKLTLITATYNSRGVIKDCLNSVTEQDYFDKEHLIIDGNSVDETLAILNRYQSKNPKIRVVSEPDLGIYDALNKGVRLANGDILGFVHSDDLLAQPDVLSKIMRCFQQNEIDGVFGDLIYVDKNNSSKNLRCWKSCDFDRKLLFRGWMPAHPTLFLRKEVYQKHGSFNLNYKIASDYDFMLRILKDPALKFVYLPEVITKMRMGGASNRSFKNLVQKSHEDYRILKSNNFSFPVLTLFLKNISKISQFF